MAFNDERVAPVFPGLGSLYDGLKPYGYPLLRIMMGLFFVPHGAQKLFGMFGAVTVEQYAAGFGRMGAFWGQPIWVYYIGCLEFFGGLLMAAGFLTRLVAIQFVCFMLTAFFVANAPLGWFWTKGGIEAPLSWGIVCFVILINGGGKFSLDKAIGKEI